MIELLLLQSPKVIAPAGPIAASAGEGTAAAVPIGFIVLAIIVGPVLLLTIAAVIESPKTSRIPELFIGAAVLLVGAIIASFAAVSALLKFIVPQ